MGFAKNLASGRGSMARSVQRLHSVRGWEEGEVRIVKLRDE